VRRSHADSARGAVPNLHRLTRRLWSWRDEFGNESPWSRQLGREVMSAGSDAFWATISAG